MKIADQLAKIPPGTKSATPKHHKQIEMIDRFREAFANRSYMTARKLSEVTGYVHSSVCAALLKLEAEGCIKRAGKIEGGKTVKWKWVAGQ